VVEAFGKIKENKQGKIIMDINISHLRTIAIFHFADSCFILG
jgi:hypothetical protein